MNKYQIIKTFLGVNTFEINKNNIVLNCNGDLISNNKLVNKCVDPRGYGFYEDKLIYIKGHQTYIGSQLINKFVLIETINENLNIAIFSTDFNVNDFTLNYEILDLKNLTILYRLGRIPVISNIIYSKLGIVCMYHELRSNHFIGLYSYERNEMIWLKDLSSYCHYTDLWKKEQIGRVEKIIGISRGLVWVATTNDTLLGMAEQTGEIKYTIRELPNINETLPFSKAILDEVKGKVINLTNTSYCEIDCTTGSVTYTDLKEEFNRHNIEAFGASDWAHDGEYIYFFNTVNTSGGRVAIFHIPTKKIVWMHVFDKEQNIRPLELQHANNRIYVRDNHNTLHIFEKE